MATRMLQRRGTAAEWAAENPILADGEMGFETDTKIIKMGDGVTTWAELGLPYLTTGGGTMTGPLNLIEPTAPNHAVRKGYVDPLIDNVENSAFEILAHWPGDLRSSEPSEPNPIANPNIVTITNPQRAVEIQAFKTFHVTKGPAVGIVEIAWLIEISIDGGVTWSGSPQVVTVVQGGLVANAGGGGAAYGHESGTPTGNIIVRFLTRRLDAQTGAVNNRSSGGYVRVTSA